METGIYAIPGFSEPVSCFTHLIAAVVFLVPSFFLLRDYGGNWKRLVSLGVFAFATIFLLSMSGVFHLLSPGTTARAVLQRLDHAAIFVLIAGTFTAVHGVLLRGIWRWGFIVLIWSVAITGLTLKVVFFDDFSEVLGLSFYLGLGWVGLFSGVVLWRVFGFSFIQPLLWGALAYTCGALLEFAQQPVLIPGVVGPHEVFHLAVLAGLAFHWRFVFDCVREDAAAV